MAKCYECDKEPEFRITLQFDRAVKGSGWTATWALCPEHALRAQQLGFDPRKPFYEVHAELAASVCWRKQLETPAPDVLVEYRITVDSVIVAYGHCRGSNLVSETDCNPSVEWRSVD